VSTKIARQLGKSPATPGAEDSLEGGSDAADLFGNGGIAAEGAVGTSSVDDLYWFYGAAGAAPAANDDSSGDGGSSEPGPVGDGGGGDGDGGEQPGPDAGEDGTSEPGDDPVPVIRLDQLRGEEGARISGSGPDRFGFSTALADVNGDGYDDLVAGAFGADHNGSCSGSVYVIFGSADGIPSGMDVTALDGSNGFRIDGQAEWDVAGFAVSAGDVNGDGLADVVLGAKGADTHGNSSGAAYVVYGAVAFAPVIPVSDLDGTSGFAMSGIAGGDEAGYEVKVAGDLNGDGYGDILVSGFPASEHPLAGTLSAGSVYVIYGAANGMPRNLELSALDGTNGFRIDGISRDAYVGWSIDSGDINGDGFDDLAIGARWEDYYAGSTYVLFGTASGLGPNVDLDALDGSNGFRIRGTQPQGGDYNVGYSVSTGDINGDGYADVIVGSKSWTGYDDEGDTSFVIYGKAGGFDAELSVADLDGSQGVRFDGAWTGAAGDVNGDGVDDLIVGTGKSEAGGHWSGAVYIVFGSTEGFEPDTDLWMLEGYEGILLVGGDTNFVGDTACAAGDVNGDGYDDVSIFARSDDGNHGITYLFYGRDFSLLGSEAPVTL
jgi:hypothetical protein